MKESDGKNGDARRRRYIPWALVVIWMGVIFAFSAVPHSSEATEQVFGTLNIPVRKLAHVTEYGIMFLLFQNAIRRNAVYAFVCTLLYALTDEWHQSYVPGRSATLSDVAVDSIGMFIAWSFVLLSSRISLGKR